MILSEYLPRVQFEVALCRMCTLVETLVRIVRTCILVLPMIFVVVKLGKLNPSPESVTEID